MASMRKIKRRIRSVGSTQQITKAMNLVAASKLQKAKGRLMETRPFYQETKRVIASIVSNSKGLNHPFLEVRQVNNIGVILLTSDRGLCGGYNTVISKETLALINRLQHESMIIVGNKGKDYFRRRKKNIVKTYSGISEKPFYDDAAEIGRLALDMFLKKQIDEVYLAYTELKSTISYVPKIIKILPVDNSEFESEAGGTMNYEPSEEAVLDYVIPKYLNTIIYGALCESAACEQGARMTSMDSATDNAEDMISRLTLLYNRARQGAITQEILEIVSGANALE